MKIKALKWDDVVAVPVYDGIKAYQFCCYSGGLDRYRVTLTEGESKWVAFNRDSAEVVGEFDSIEGAKDACQAEHALTLMEYIEL